MNLKRGMRPGIWWQSGFITRVNYRNGLTWNASIVCWFESFRTFFHTLSIINSLEEQTGVAICWQWTSTCSTSASWIKQKRSSIKSIQFPPINVQKQRRRRMKMPKFDYCYSQIIFANSSVKNAPKSLLAESLCLGTWELWRRSGSSPFSTRLRNSPANSSTSMHALTIPPATHCAFLVGVKFATTHEECLNCRPLFVTKRRLNSQALEGLPGCLEVQLL